jgi:spore coat protein A
VVLEPFVDPLPIPAVAQPVTGTAGGAATYRLAVREVQQQLHRDLQLTTVWGYGDGRRAPPIPAPPSRRRRACP